MKLRIRLLLIRIMINIFLLKNYISNYISKLTSVDLLQAVALLGLIRGNLMQRHKEILRILLNQAAILHHLWLIIIHYQTYILIDTN